MLFALAFVVSAPAQRAAPVLYSESFRQGTVHIEEDEFGVGLNSRGWGLVERITDSHGRDRYELIIQAQLADAGDQVAFWSLVLVDLRHPKVGNLFMSEPEPSVDPTQNLWRLYLGRASPVPTDAKRIIKVDGFYVKIEVRDVHFQTSDAPYPDRADINLTITNSDPRASH